MTDPLPLLPPPPASPQLIVAGDPGAPGGIGSADVPEPASFGILAIALLGLAGIRRTRSA